MRNKTIFLSLILLFFFASSAFSQENSSKLSINIYEGYGPISPASAYFTMYGDAHGSTNNNSGVNQTNSTTAYNRTKEALGNGTHIGLGVSYELNKFISIGIDADYLTGKKNASLNIPSDTLTGSFASTHSALSIIPNISFRLLTLSKYHIYNTIGIIEAVQTKFNYSYVAVESQSVTTSNNKYKYGLNTGFKDALGIQIGVAKNIQVFAELSGYFLPARPTSKSEVTDYSSVANGVTTNQVTNANISYTNAGGFNYLQTTTSGTTNVSYNEQAPHQHFYSVGLNAGIRINLPY